MYVVAFDYGKSYIGVALTDLSINIPFPIENIYCKKSIPNWLALDKISEDWKPAYYVIGFPYSCRHKKIAKKILFFKKNVEKRYSKQTYLVNEDFSTYESFYKLRNLKNNRRPKRLDNNSAALILDSWLLHGHIHLK